jgi:hypothetical protein
MTSAPLAISGFDGGSNLTKYRVPVLSRTVRPGEIPSLFAPTMVQTPD